MEQRQLGLNIKRLRQERGLSQARAAARAGVDPATWNQVETRARKPNIETLERMASGLDVEMADLFAGYEIPKVEPPLPFNQVAEERGDEEQQRRSFFANAIISAANRLIRIVEDPATNDQKRFGVGDAASALADYAVEHVDEEVWDALTNEERRELIGVQEKLLEVVEQVTQHIEGRQAEEEVAERREKIKEWTRQLSA